MGQHIHKIEHQHIQFVVLEHAEVLHQLLAGGAVVHLGVREMGQGLNERSLVQVLALLALLIDPQVGEHALDIDGHQSREDGVAGILCCRGQDGGVQLLALDIVDIGKQGADGPPLVQPEVVDDHEADFLLVV